MTTTGEPQYCTKPGIFPIPGCKGFVICIAKSHEEGFYQLIYDCPNDLYYSLNHGYCVNLALAPSECQPTTTPMPTTCE